MIVNFSSGWGRSTSPEVAPYCATKYAIEGLTLALAQELPEGMCAVPLNPGIINTDMLQTAFGEGASAYPTPEKWAEKAVPFPAGARPEGQRQVAVGAAMRPAPGIHPAALPIRELRAVLGRQLAPAAAARAGSIATRSKRPSSSPIGRPASWARPASAAARI